MAIRICETDFAIDPEGVASKLAQDHWSYVKNILKFETNEKELEVIEQHYITAFKHGFKHGAEEEGKRVQYNV